MNRLTFSGGIHPPQYKELTKGSPIKIAPLPSKVVIPVSQHTGTPARAIVSKGDYVLTGQEICELQGKISASVHSSVSGKVTDILPWCHPVINQPVVSVVIESDGRDTKHEIKKTYWDYFRYSPQQIRKVIEDSGIVGLGGAAFPTQVKLTPPKEIDTVLLNGCECEPFLTCDDILMQKYPKEIVEGLKIVMYILDLYQGFIVIEDNKPEAIKSIQKVVYTEPNISVKVVKTKYPQGAERQLIKSALNRDVPYGKLPFEVGVVVQNVATCFAIYKAVVLGETLFERIVTVTGDYIKYPGNYNVRIGTLLSDLLTECGYIHTEEPHKIIFGGPMMGITQQNLNVPVVKGTSGIVVLSEKLSGKFMSEYQPCIRCGKCIEVCPMNLMPNYLSVYAESSLWTKCSEFYPTDCIECGACAYVCVAKRPIVQHIKLAKLQRKSSARL